MTTNEAHDELKKARNMNEVSKVQADINDVKKLKEEGKFTENGLEVVDEVADRTIELLKILKSSKAEGTSESTDN